MVRGWNVYNKLRFGKKNKRYHKAGATTKELEKYFRLDENSCFHLQSANDISIDFIEDHKILISEGNQETKVSYQK